MNKIIATTLLSFYSIIFAQVDCEKDSIKYSIAYNYIANNYPNGSNKIIVSDSIIDLDRFFGAKGLTDFPEEKEKLNQYREKKNYIWFEPFYSSCLASMFSIKDTAARNILFFSQIEDNILIAEVFPLFLMPNHIKKRLNIFRYNEVSFQNTSIYYLFIFDKNTIEAVFRNEIERD